jgi:uridine kinase
VFARLQPLLGAATHPVVVAIDGRRGAGKSTIAAGLAGATAAVVVPSDDFFAATLAAAEWEARSAEERARDAIDWRRLRRLAIEPLRAGRAAEWHPFDFEGGERPDGSYAIAATTVRREPAPLIFIEGAYCSRPELADLIDLAILVDAPADVRRARLAARESAEFLAAWHRRWDAAEDHYFTAVRPQSTFDLILNTASSVLRSGAAGTA